MYFFEDKLSRRNPPLPETSCLLPKFYVIQRETALYITVLSKKYSTQKKSTFFRALIAKSSAYRLLKALLQEDVTIGKIGHYSHSKISE